jgi:hypothetical protein
VEGLFSWNMNELGRTSGGSRVCHMGPLHILQAKLEDTLIKKIPSILENWTQTRFH